MIIHSFLLILTLSFGNTNTNTETPDTNTNATTPTSISPPLTSLTTPIWNETLPTYENGTVIENGTLPTINGTSKCRRENSFVIEPSVPCKEGGLKDCTPYEREGVSVHCDRKLLLCCISIPQLTVKEFCPGVAQFTLDKMPSCDSYVDIANSERLEKCSDFHSCHKLHCCPKTGQKDGMMSKYLFNSSIPCEDEQINLETVAKGVFCGNEGWLRFLGSIHNGTFHMLSSNMSCQNNGECEVGMICVKTTSATGQCHTVILTIPPPPPTTTTTTTKKTTTTFPEEATTPDPYYSWSAYLARGWERNKVLFYLSIMFTVLGLLGTCFFWLKKKFFKWIMRPDPGEETPSERAMRLAFDLVEERQRQERRRRK